MKKGWLWAIAFVAAFSLSAQFTSLWRGTGTYRTLPAGSNRTVEIPGGLTHIGPLPMIAMGSDNHGQDDTWIYKFPLMDQYQLPYTFWLRRGTGQPDGKANDPVGEPDLTNSELIDMMNHPLAEIGTHGNTHATMQHREDGYASSRSSTNVYGYKLQTAWDEGGSGPAVDDIMWLFSSGGPTLIQSITNSGHLVVTDAPGNAGVRQHYYIDKFTKDIAIDCDGTTTVDLPESTACTGAGTPWSCCSTSTTWTCYDNVSPGSDGPDLSFFSQLISNGAWASETPSGRGGLLIIEDVTDGAEIFWIEDFIDASPDQLVLNRACTVPTTGESDAFLGESTEMVADSYTDSVKAFRDDTGNPNLKITSYGSPNDSTSSSEQLTLMSRGIHIIPTGQGANFNPMHMKNAARPGIVRSFTDVNDTPAGLRSMVDAVIDANAFHIFNFESAVPELILEDPVSLGSITSGTRVLTCDGGGASDCDFLVSDINAGDVIHIDDDNFPIAHEILTIDSATQLTWVTTEPTASAALVSKDFWIVDTNASILNVNTKTLETLFRYLDSKRADVVTMKTTDMMDRAALLSDSPRAANVIMNPLWRTIRGAKVTASPDFQPTSTYFDPWQIQSQTTDMTIEVVLRHGTRQLKVDATGTAAGLFQMAQRIHVQPNRLYRTWVEYELENVTGTPVELMSIIRNMHTGGENDSTNNTSLQSSGVGSTTMGGRSGVAVEGIWPSYLSFSTHPSIFWQVLVDDDGGATSTGTWMHGLRLLPLSGTGLIVDETGVGTNTVRGLPSEGAMAVHITASNDTGGFCSIAEDSESDQPDSVLVECYNPAGALEDMDFLITGFPSQNGSGGSALGENESSLTYAIRVNCDCVFYVRPAVVTEDLGFNPGA